MTRVTGGILAGGEGKRFGSADKGWLEHAGKPFVTHVRDALAPQVDEVLISANRNQARYAGLGHRVVSDSLGAGPAAGLLALLEEARHSWLLCVPCDALALPPTLARDMLDAQWADEADIVVLHEVRDGTDHVHPTCCLVLTALAPHLRRYLAQGQTALGRWQSQHRVAHCEAGAPLANINDAQALAAFGVRG